MNTSRNTLFFIVGVIIFIVLAIGMVSTTRIAPVQAAQQALPRDLNLPQAPSACTNLGKPSDLPQPALINFDDLAGSAVIGDHYYSTFGVSFEDNPTNKAIIYGNEPAKAASPPNVASNSAIFPNTSNNVPMVINFSEPKTHVGMYIGNSDNTGIVALLTAYNADGQVICQARYTSVPEPATLFVGFYDPTGTIIQLTLDYGNTSLSETIDDLYFSPRNGLPTTRPPLPTWTPVPSPTPTQGPPPTPTPVFNMKPYKPVVKQVYTFSVLPDLSIHGIEITQGIQCFDTSKGLTGCADNSLPVITQKDATARVYLKTSPLYSSLANVPVRLYLIANGITYTANATGKATQTIDQTKKDSADVYFNVNFTNNVSVQFYAIVDPDNTISESNESNNRYPAAGTITLTFQKRRAEKIVGYRVDYHPSGYTGTRYASGWAVNGGSADWYEQVLPLRNNGINYSVRSSYLNWTSSLTPCSSTSGADNQHSLIQTLNSFWVLENTFAFWFSGAFTGANQVYGWVPDAGYPCGHADMPVYPHAGGLGVVGIGSDAPGTNTDNPGAGALIFGHELTHDYDIKHTNTADSCGSNDSSSGFPYSSSSIQEVGFNPMTGKIYDPSTTHDLMSYCPSGGSKQGWISPFTWNQMFTHLAQPIALSAVPQGDPPTGVLSPSAGLASLEVNVTIFNPDNKPPKQGQLNNLFKTEAGSILYLPDGPYAVELHDINDNTLISQSFNADFKSEYDGHAGPQAPQDAPPFPPTPTGQADISFIMEWMDGTTKVVLTKDGATIDEKTVSANPPQVFFTSPSGAESWLPGSKHTLSWQGLDLDGDPLSYALFYSYDGGLNWGLLAGNLSSTSYEVQTDSMAGGSDVRFRIVATDGVLTGVDETDAAITIPNQSPQVTILNPLNGGFYPPGSLVVLQGFATDMEDGTLPDEALQWSSDVQGGLGTGPSLALNELQSGKHVITLSAADSYGIVSNASVTINIANGVFLPRVSRK